MELVESSSDEDESGLTGEKRSVVDLEDLGNLMKNAKKAKVRIQSAESLFTTGSSSLTHRSTSFINIQVPPAEGEIVIKERKKKADGLIDSRREAETCVTMRTPTGHAGEGWVTD